jgi:hypothetical protein
MCRNVYGDVMKKTPVLLIAYFVWVSETRVDAYLDPGSGSMLVQLLLGGVAGAAVVMKLGWERFKDMFRSTRAARGEGPPRVNMSDPNE